MTPYALLARAVAQFLSPAKGRVIVYARRGEVYDNHARLGIATKIRRVFQAARGDPRRQAEIGVIGDV